MALMVWTNRPGELAVAMGRVEPFNPCMRRVAGAKEPVDMFTADQGSSRRGEQAVVTRLVGQIGLAHAPSGYVGVDQWRGLQASATTGPRRRLRVNRV